MGREEPLGFTCPFGIALDGSGNIYVTDRGSCTPIREITPGGVVTTLAGDPGVSGNDDGTGIAARFDGPEGIAVDGIGNVYVTTNRDTIRKVTPEGVVSTIGGTPGVIGGTDGLGSKALFSSVRGAAMYARRNSLHIRLGEPPNIERRGFDTSGCEPDRRSGEAV